MFILEIPFYLSYQLDHVCVICLFFNCIAFICNRKVLYMISREKKSNLDNDHLYILHNLNSILNYRKLTKPRNALTEISIFIVYCK